MKSSSSTDSLSIITGTYDAFTPLKDGTVQASLPPLVWLSEEDPPKLFSRLVERQDVDIAEMSLSQYARLRSVGSLPYRAIPVFPLRMFRHAYVAVRSELHDVLAGGGTGLRIGVPDYWQTAAVWIRGIFREGFGFDWQECEWVQGGMDEPRPQDLMSDTAHRALVNLRPQVSITVVDDHSLDDLIYRGELDMTIGARLPMRAMREGRTRALLADHRQQEELYYVRTRIFPIMHTLVIREDRLAQWPDLPRALTDAFNDAAEVKWKRLQFSGANSSLLPWGHEDAVVAEKLFSGNPWRHGLDHNRKTIETFLAYLRADGLDSIPPIESLFAR